MEKRYVLLIGLLALFVISGCSADEQGVEKKQEDTVELTISAAASLQESLQEIAAVFEQKNPGIRITFNFGSSGALARQISQGAPADLFFSAAEDKFTQVKEKGLIDEDAWANLLGNELALVVPIDTEQEISTFDAIVKAERISIGTPSAVPAGKYAQETLEGIGVWEDVESKVVYAKDVRQVLTYVETGNVDAGIVYKTDALVSDKVKVAATADETMHTPVIYPAGIVKNSAYIEEAQLFYSYVQEEESIKIFEKYGFKGLTNRGS